MPLSSSAPGGFVEFRRILPPSFFLKFYLTISSQLSNKAFIPDIERTLSSGVQVSDVPLDGEIGVSRPHLSALKQCTGQALYIDDMHFHNEATACIVPSGRAHAIIKSVDWSLALLVKGVYGYVDWTDVPGMNSSMIDNFNGKHNPNVIGPVFQDEELFATKRVFFVGQMVGMVIAESEDCARRAVKLVKIEYEDQESVITIEVRILKLCEEG